MSPAVLNAVTRPGPESNLYTVRASIEVTQKFHLPPLGHSTALNILLVPEQCITPN